MPEQASTHEPQEVVTSTAEPYAKENASGVREVEESFKPQGKGGTSLWFLLLAGIGMIISGTGSSIFTKWQNRLQAPKCNGCEVEYFEGPFLQTFMMYVGEAACLLIWWVDRIAFSRGKAYGNFDFPTSDTSFNKPPCPIWWWIVPTTFDCIASSMNNYATVFAQTSTIQMLRNFSVIVTCVCRIFYLKIALRVHQWLGAFVITCGLIIVGTYAILNPDKDTNYEENMQWLGIVLAVGGTTVTAFQFIFEESLFRKYYCSPFVAVGWSGIFGGLITLVIILIGHFAGFEDTKGNLYMATHAYGNNVPGQLWGAIVLYIFVVCLFNGSGLMVTKLGSGIHRAVCLGLRTVTVWIVELCLKWNTFHGLNFAGLMVLLLGAFIYNYNYVFVRDGWWRYDHTMKKGLGKCCGIRDPDMLDAPPSNTTDDYEESFRAEQSST